MVFSSVLSVPRRSPSLPAYSVITVGDPVTWETEGDKYILRGRNRAKNRRKDEGVGERGGESGGEIRRRS